MKRRNSPNRPNHPFRATWKGQLRFGLVSFAVEAINVHAAERGDIHFHQLHDECHSRIRYQKVCPVHGQVTNNEIISGYEYEKGKYVEIDADELDELRSDKERSLSIDNFVASDEIDPLYLDGRMYFLVPAATESIEPYQVLVKAMEHRKRYGVGHVVFSGKDQIVLVRPKDGVLMMAMLNYAAEIREPGDLGAVGTDHKVAARTMKLAEDLIDSWTDRKFDFAAYEDKYRHRLEELIADKIAGREVVTPAEEEEAPVINLMDALKRSMAKSRSASSKRKMPATKATGHRRRTSRKRAS
jgi:DNA end-binding protein Ku